MASSASGQDNPNRAMWLATRAGNPQEELPRKPYNKSFIDHVCSVKMVGYWPRSFFFCEFIDLDFVSVHKHAKKELGQYPAILTSHSVNNPYVLSLFDGSYVLEHRRLDGVVNRSFLLLCCIKTNRFLFTVRLFSNSSQKKSIKNFSDTLRLA